MIRVALAGRKVPEMPGCVPKLLGKYFLLLKMVNADGGVPWSWLLLPPTSAVPVIAVEPRVAWWWLPTGGGGADSRLARLDAFVLSLALVVKWVGMDTKLVCLSNLSLAVLSTMSNTGIVSSASSAKDSEVGGETEGAEAVSPVEEVPPGDCWDWGWGEEVAQGDG